MAASLLTTAAVADDLVLVDSENSGAGPCGLALAEMKERTYLLVGSHFEDRLTSYRVDRANGELTLAKKTSLPPGSGPVAVGFAYGRYAVVANQASSTLYTYRMNRNGRFRDIGAPVPTRGAGPVDMAVAASGLVAVSNNASNELSVFFLDDKGGLEFLDKMPTGLGPTGVAIHEDRIAVANYGSSSVSLYRMNRLRNLQLERTTPLSQPPLTLAFDLRGRNLYAATDGSPLNEPSRLHRFRVKNNGKLKERNSIDAGLLLSGLALDGRNIYAATLTAGGMNTVSVFNSKLEPKGLASLSSAPSSMTLYSNRIRGRRYVFSNEFGNGTTNSFELR